MKNVILSASLLIMSSTSFAGSSVPNSARGGYYEDYSETAGGGNYQDTYGAAGGGFNNDPFDTTGAVQAARGGLNMKDFEESAGGLAADPAADEIFQEDDPNLARDEVESFESKNVVSFERGFTKTDSPKKSAGKSTAKSVEYVLMHNDQFGKNLINILPRGKIIGDCKVLSSGMNAKNQYSILIQTGNGARFSHTMHGYSYTALNRADLGRANIYKYTNNKHGYSGFKILRVYTTGLKGAGQVKRVSIESRKIINGKSVQEIKKSYVCGK